MKNNLFDDEYRTCCSTEFIQLQRTQLNEDNAADFYIHSALKELNTHQYPIFIQDLDELIAQYLAQRGPWSTQYYQDPRKVKSLLWMSSHIGAYLAQQLGIAEQWLSIEERSQINPQLVRYHQHPEYQFSLKCHDQYVLILGTIIQHFSQKQSIKLSDELHSIILNLRLQHIEQSQNYSAEMAALEHLYPNHLALLSHRVFLDAIHDANLDYSLLSLKRIDTLMTNIKKQHPTLDEAQFLAKKEYRYFIQFLSAYLANVIAQQAHTTLQWYHPHQLHEKFDVLVPERFATSRIAHIQHCFFFIMQHICDFLFYPSPRQSSLRYCQNALERIQLHQKNLYPEYVRQTSADMMKNQPLPKQTQQV